jgi:hypothetical protein
MQQRIVETMERLMADELYGARSRALAEIEELGLLKELLKEVPNANG